MHGLNNWQQTKAVGEEALCWTAFVFVVQIKDIAVTRKVKVILNTYGGSLPGQTKIDLTEQALQAVKLDYDLEVTEFPEQGVELARRASEEGWPIVVAAGGDGTINAVVNGLIQAAGEAEAGILGIIPLGTANDLADGLGLPSDPEFACQRIAIGKTRLIDVGQVNGRYFANNSAVGLEAVVTANHDRMRWVKGNTRYILAALKAIITAKPWQMKVTWDNGQYDGPTILVSVGNNCRTGGKFYLTPNAMLEDGLIDFVYATGMSRWQLFRLLPKTFSGDHIHHPMVNYKQTKTLSLSVSPPTLIQADGEIFEKNATNINYCVVPQKLHVIV